MLSLNLGKSSTMSFEKHDKIYPFIHNINDRELNKVSSINDLGITFSPNLQFDTHMESVVCQCTKLLGFIKR